MSVASNRDTNTHEIELPTNMGNTYSANLRIELYKWSSVEFPQEHALIYTSLTDKSNFSIFRLSVKPEKVLFRLADSLCDNHPVRLHTEVTAERNNYGSFNFRVVRIVEAGTNNQAKTPLFDEACFDYHCERKVCSFHVGRRTGMLGSWRVDHWYKVDFKTYFTFKVNIVCDKVTGLSAKFKGPFRSEFGQFDEESGSLIQCQVNGEPPKHINSIVQSMFTGNQYILFKQGKGNTLIDDDDEESKMVVINNSGTFYGNHNGCFN